MLLNLFTGAAGVSVPAAAAAAVGAEIQGQISKERRIEGRQITGGVLCTSNRPTHLSNVTHAAKKEDSTVSTPSTNDTEHSATDTAVKRS
jgi:hypothetical protein